MGSSPQAAFAKDYNIYTGPNDSDRVILTFDDCPKTLESFKATLKDFSKMGVRVALFPTGNCIKAGRFDQGYALALGHYVFNHSITHPDFSKMNVEKIVKELESPGIVSTYGRPPYGAVNKNVHEAYKKAGMKIWNWDVDTNDWRGKSSSEITKHVVNNTGKGNTVLMHMQWNGFNEETVSNIRKGLAKRNIGLCLNTGPVIAKPNKVNCESFTPLLESPLFWLQ